MHPLNNPAFRRSPAFGGPPPGMVLPGKGQVIVNLPKERPKGDPGYVGYKFPSAKTIH